MTYKSLAGSILAAVIGVLPVNAQEGGFIVSSLIGTWTSECDAWGTPAICTSTWKVGAHNSHLVQEYAIVGKENGNKLFSGRGIYRVQGEKVNVYWEDSQGAIHPLTGVYRDNTIEVIWGTPGKEMGRSSYAHDDATLLVRDSSLTQVGWRDFMVVEYTPD